MRSDQSSSVHTLNADTGLTMPKKALYFFVNFLNNVWFPTYSADPAMKIKDFKVSIEDTVWEKLPKSTSPSRRLSDLFWLKLPWQEIESELGQLKVFDTGCGSGNYSTQLQKFSEGRIKSYTGIDVKARPEWKQLESIQPWSKFFVANSADLGKKIPPDTNFFISQSAIEHFKYDLEYFRIVRDFIKNKKESCLQIHLFPSAACLRLYLLHGIRQYVPRTVGKITKLFSEFSSATLFKLGGRESGQLHWNAITKPHVLKRSNAVRNTVEYDEAVKRAIEHDMNAPRKNYCCFYALVIQSFHTSDVVRAA